MIKQCIICGNDFKMYQKVGYDYIGKTCSRDCFFASRRKGVDTPCVVCGKNVYVIPWKHGDVKSDAIICGRECRKKHQNENPEMYAKNKSVDRAEVIRLYCEGFKQREIAGGLNCSIGLVRVILRTAKVPRKYRHEYLDKITTFSAIARRLKKEKGDRCTICGWDEAPCDVHHILSRKDGGTNEYSNLIILCPNHHRLVTKKLLVLA